MLTVGSNFSPFETKKRTRLMRAERETEKILRKRKRERETKRERES